MQLPFITPNGPCRVDQTNIASRSARSHGFALLSRMRRSTWRIAVHVEPDLSALSFAAQEQEQNH
jgi:hypothetical protein